MTALTVMQNAAIRLIGRKPPAFFSASDQFEMEMTSLLNEVAREIAATHDWQVLTKVHTFAGDGTTTDFTKPEDYDRMPVVSGISDAQSWLWGYSPVPDMDAWVSIQSGNNVGMAPGWWILLGDLFRFAPAPTGSALMPYVSRNCVLEENGTPKAEFTADTDTFRMDERLLTLGLIWRWREMKQLDVSGEHATFEKAFSEVAARDRGSRVLRSRSRYNPLNLRSAWPWELGPDVP